MSAYKSGFFLAVLGIAAALILDTWAPHFRSRVAPDKSPDDGDVEVVLDRVVSLAPNITETIFAIGAEDRLAGVSSFCRYPPAAEDKTNIGAIANPNLETILAIRPDGLLVQQPNPRLKDFCQSRDIAYFELKMNDLAKIRKGIAKLGRLLESEEAASQLIGSIETSLDEMRNNQSSQKPGVLLLTGRTPGSLKGMYAAGSTSYMSELLHFAGGENIMDDVAREFVPVSLETVIERDPEIIIETYMHASLPESIRSRLRSDWQRVPRLAAVKNNNIHIVTENFVQIPGPRIMQTAELFARLCSQSSAAEDEK